MQDLKALCLDGSLKCKCDIHDSSSIHPVHPLDVRFDVADSGLLMTRALHSEMILKSKIKELHQTSMQHQPRRSGRPLGLRPQPSIA